MPAKPTKTDAVIRLLRRSSGATNAQIQKVTGWKPHSVRAALTGLRKKGHDVQRGKDTKGVTTYRITKAL